MGLFSRFKRRRRIDEYVGRHRPGAWGEIALPPMEPAPESAAAPAEAGETVTTAPAPAVVPVANPPAEVAHRQRVRLSFADGSSVDLDDTCGASAAIREAAQRIIVE